MLGWRVSFALIVVELAKKSPMVAGRSPTTLDITILSGGHVQGHLLASTRAVPAIQVPLVLFFFQLQVATKGEDRKLSRIPCAVRSAARAVSTVSSVVTWCFHPAPTEWQSHKIKLRLAALVDSVRTQQCLLVQLSQWGAHRCELKSNISFEGEERQTILLQTRPDQCEDWAY
jgi:hypothetical protein